MYFLMSMHNVLTIAHYDPEQIYLRNRKGRGQTI